MVYKLINVGFKPVLYRPYNDNEKLIDFWARYILKSLLNLLVIYMKITQLKIKIQKISFVIILIKLKKQEINAFYYMVQGDVEKL